MQVVQVRISITTESLMLLPCGAAGGIEELGGCVWELVLVAIPWGCIRLPVFVCGKDEALQSYRVYYHVPGPICTPSTCTLVAQLLQWPVEIGILLSRESHWW